MKSCGPVVPMRTTRPSEETDFLLVHVLWLTLVFGGLFMGGGAVVTQLASGFDLVLTLSAILYLGCALYSLPRLWGLWRGNGS